MIRLEFFCFFFFFFGTGTKIFSTKHESAFYEENQNALSNEYTNLNLPIVTQLKPISPLLE